MQRLIAVLVVFLLSGVAAAEPAVTTFRLDNGMDVVVIEDHRAPVVTHMVWYRVGAADEPPGKSGVAHFLEHLMFKGTNDIPESAFSKIIAANGGQDNAFTAQDYTGYFQRIAVDRLDLVMKMEADRMRNLVLTEALVNPERDVVIEERNSRVENDPGSLFSEQRDAAFFQNHPYGIPIIGWRNEIEALSLEDSLAFYRRYYAPNNAILVVAGDVTPDQVEQLAKTYYGPLAPSDLPPRVRPQEPKHLAPIRITFSDKRVRQPYVVRTYLAPTRGTGDTKRAAALEMLATVLGGDPVTSHLATLQVDRKIAVASGAFYRGTSVDANVFGVYVIPLPGVTLAEAEAAMDEEIMNFIETGPSEEQLERIKTIARADWIYEQDSQFSVARRYGSELSMGLSVEEIQTWPQLLQDVTAEDVVAAAKDVFDLRQSITGWLTTEEVTQ
jgi:zinc protease